MTTNRFFEIAKAIELENYDGSNFPQLLLKLFTFPFRDVIEFPDMFLKLGLEILDADTSWYLSRRIRSPGISTDSQKYGSWVAVAQIKSEQNYFDYLDAVKASGFMENAYRLMRLDDYRWGKDLGHDMHELLDDFDSKDERYKLLLRRKILEQDPGAFGDVF